ncbi:hypothetical protein, partial [Bradyrhizobium japonicum]|uniref:hypothetical protein n=1 Tax=Bradyrhizobium japonicum TaxID=375 RepID=UPI001AF01176
LQQTAVLAMAMGLVLTAPIGALQRSSQPPTSECCDDRLNPPNSFGNSATGGQVGGTSRTGQPSTSQKER